MSQPHFQQPVVPIPAVAEELADSPDSAGSPDSPSSPSSPGEPGVYEPTIIDVPPVDPPVRPEDSR